MLFLKSQQKLYPTSSFPLSYHFALQKNDVTIAVVCTVSSLHLKKEWKNTVLLPGLREKKRGKQEQEVHWI